MSIRAKLIIALTIFIASFITKSLQATDLAAAMYTSDQPFSIIAYGYDRKAVAILGGEGLLGPYGIDPSQTVALSRPPGYAIFLSALYSISGRDFFAVQIFQNLINSLSPVLIFLIAGIMIGWRVGAVSGFIAAVSHHFSHISNFILPDAITALPILVGAGLITFAFRFRNHAYWIYILAGAMFGLSVWLRPQAMLLAPFLMLIIPVIATRRWFAIRRVAVMVVASFIVIAPITLRNYIVYGEFVPVSIGVGITLWEGIGEYSGDRFGAVTKDWEVADQEAVLYNNPEYAGSWATPDGIQRDRDRIKKSLRIIIENPVWYAGVMRRRMRDMTKYSAHAPLIFRRDQVKTEAVLPVKREWREIAPESPRLGIGASFSWLRTPLRAIQRLIKEPMQFFVLFGLIVVALMSPRRAAVLMMLPLYYLLFQSFLHTEFRYTLPMQYFLFTFAAAFWYLLGAGVWKAVTALMEMTRQARSEN
jgi:hypothetical protein